MCGVPQGSILDTLLFILFINDIINISKLTKFIIFANDTNFLFFAYNLTKLYENVNIELTKISKWLKINMLSLNIKNTNFVIGLFRNTNEHINNENVQIKIDQIVSDQVDKTKLIEVIINENLKIT